MRVFLTGATGFIGSAVLSELLSAGHEVLGLTRSEPGAQALKAAGAEIHRGDIADPDSLRAGAALCDGVIHTAFDHDFTRFVENCEKDRHAIAALGSALEGTDRPLVLTSTTAIGTPAPGRPAVEDHFDPEHPNPRIASELAGRMLSARGVHVSVMRLSQIHDTRRQGLVSNVIDLARDKGISAYVGDGATCWSAAHVSDAARLFRLALERQEPGARYHATAEGAIPFRDIAEAVGRRLGLPVAPIPAEEAAEHFGWLAAFAGRDMSASSAWTQERLDWHPAGPGLITDIDNLPQGKG
ncbi:SDR family oxidoreductase [Celeribacter indicus]|uniref:NAD-dependent epimerase/dehydratase n=1 Tax=Celeribacter indicus TaxID=1208324 RepID=A0A0B5DXH9_9RHOB|nr:SDR family oxidoreductase [Celeribacter indicus]AJE45805.1 NAD-dependent epimerase/dehydratase [Celeribacter indicus]SDW61085.1 Nucleoside-diphosphate-sugar epimerase [Celeribacter indicus]